MGCAWENLPEGQQKKQVIVQTTMRLAGDLNPNYFYYIVFNVTGKPDNKPQSIFDGDDRGKFWNVYYMWGTPPFRATGLYRGFGGTSKSGKNLVDREPKENAYLNELLPGTIVEGSSITLRINLTGLVIPGNVINMNMIVCNQAIDATSKLEYEHDPFVFDSFYAGGITINLAGTYDFFNEALNPQENLPNENEDIAPPSANIVNWNFQIIS